ncbi:unnamed protein product [Linum trigynum]|uniref:Uncharacterized protein n=1 Tax=Linum trigynum TaxID=586398 RepID=A0AAV2C750_9ROSI
MHAREAVKLTSCTCRFPLSKPIRGAEGLTASKRRHAGWYVLESFGRASICMQSSRRLHACGYLIIWMYMSYNETCISNDIDCDACNACTIPTSLAATIDTCIGLHPIC